MNSKLSRWRKKREQEWTLFESRALRLLERPQEVDPGDGLKRLRPEVRLWHYKSSSAFRSWTIFSPDARFESDIRPRVREVIWHRRTDNNSLFAEQALKLDLSQIGVSPSLSVRDAALPLEAVQVLLESFSKLEIPLVRQQSQAAFINNELYGVENFAMEANVRLTWYSTGPPAWNRLIQWSSSMRSLHPLHARDPGE